MPREIGDGNHFAEVSRGARAADPEAAAAIGLGRGAIVVLVHSGSRGLGAALADAWADHPLRCDDRASYLGELAGASGLRARTASS